jgi:hypothetical protein
MNTWTSFIPPKSNFFNILKETSFPWRARDSGGSAEDRLFLKENLLDNHKKNKGINLKYSVTRNFQIYIGT